MKLREIMKPLAGAEQARRAEIKESKYAKTTEGLPQTDELYALKLGGRFSDEDKIDITDENGVKVGEIKKSILEYFEKLDGAAYLSGVMNALTDGIIAIDGDGKIFFVNEMYSQMLGVPRGKILGRYLQDIEPGADLLKVLKTREPFTMERKHIETIDKYVSGRIIPLFDGGEFMGAVSVFRDSTEIIRLNRQIERANSIVSEMQSRMEVYEQLKNQEIIGANPAFLNIMHKAQIAAKTDAPVMIRGENGAGKEVVAKFIHKNSDRGDKPLITVNCAAIPENLIESELFGYEEGAFTGAKKGGQIGKFEMADGGTLFLDEIGDMPYAMQTKLLRAIQENQIEKIGSGQSVKVDVRIITATNQPLEEMMQSKEFRRDLYYRINTVTLTVMPLRERREDLPLLANHFLDKCNKHYGKHVVFTPEVMQAFLEYPWEGNIRELKNCVEYGVIMSQNGLFDRSVLNIRTEGLSKADELSRVDELSGTEECSRAGGLSRTERLSSGAESESSALQGSGYEEAAQGGAVQGRLAQEEAVLRKELQGYGGCAEEGTGSSAENSGASVSAPYGTCSDISAAFENCTLKEAGEAAEKLALIAALKRCGGNREEVMKQLDISRRTFYRKMKELKINQ